MEHARVIAVAPPEPKIAGSYIRSMMPHRGRMMLLDRVTILIARRQYLRIGNVIARTLLRLSMKREEWNTLIK